MCNVCRHTLHTHSLSSHLTVDYSVFLRTQLQHYENKILEYNLLRPFLSVKDSDDKVNVYAQFFDEKITDSYVFPLTTFSNIVLPTSLPILT